MFDKTLLRPNSVPKSEVGTNSVKQMQYEKSHNRSEKSDSPNQAMGKPITLEAKPTDRTDRQRQRGRQRKTGREIESTHAYTLEREGGGSEKKREREMHTSTRAQRKRGRQADRQTQRDPGRQRRWGGD